MIYELWYEDSPNIIDAYTTEAEALAEVCAFVEDHGSASVEKMVLLVTANDAPKRVIARGVQLAARAAQVPKHAS